MPTHSTKLSGSQTPRLRAHEDRAKIEALFASIGEGVIATDERGIITRVNQAALDILGYKEADLLGEWFPGKIGAYYEDGSDIDKLDRPIMKAILAGETISETIFYKDMAGRNIPVMATVSPIILNNRPIGAIEVIRDITLDLENDKLKTEFISIASHQLRTPLSSINMYSHMLRQGLGGSLTNTQESFLDVILASAARMNQLINTLLNITRIEAGSIAVEPRPTDLQHIVGQLIAEVMPEAEDKNINLKVMPAPAFERVNTDELLYREICANLLSNAIKYTPNGGNVTISLGRKGQHIIISVTDTGYGIPKSAQPRIFTKFYRASNIIKQDVSGTGLGLYLIKILAEKLDGELWFESQLNKGSTFYFSLPMSGSMKRSGQFRLEA